MEERSYVVPPLLHTHDVNWPSGAAASPLAPDANGAPSGATGTSGATGAIGFTRTDSAPDESHAHSAMEALPTKAQARSIANSEESAHADTSRSGRDDGRAK